MLESYIDLKGLGTYFYLLGSIVFYLQFVKGSDTVDSKKGFIVLVALCLLCFATVGS